MRKGLGLSQWKTAPEFQPDSSRRFAGSGQEDDLAAQLSTSLVTWPAGRWLPSTSVSDQAQSLREKSQMETTWKVSRALSLLLSHTLPLHLPRLAALGSNTLAFMSVPATLSQTFPATIWLLGEGQQKTAISSSLFLSLQKLPGLRAILSIFVWFALFWHQLMSSTLVCNLVAGVCCHKGHLFYKKS